VLDVLRRRWGHLVAAAATPRYAPPGGVDHFARFGWRVAALRFALDDAARLGRESAAGKLARAALWLAGRRRGDALKRRDLPGVALLQPAEVR
jgi:hypothetical protein